MFYSLKRSGYAYALILLGCFSARADLVVYTYDSLTGKGSLGQKIEERFAKQSKVKIRWVPFGSSGEALSQFLLEQQQGTADVLWGLDQCQMVTALKSGLFLPYSKKLDDELEKNTLLDSTHTFLPFDYGYLAFVYDSKRTKRLPINLKNFSQDPAFRKTTVIQDPRTSSLGLGFLVWIRTLFGAEKEGPFWQAFSKQLVTISPGWSAAYGMFLKKEVDFVLSYTTSPAYHRENEKTDQFKALLFPEGHYRQVEFVGVAKTSKQQIEAGFFFENAHIRRGSKGNCFDAVDVSCSKRRSTPRKF